jgi:excinuclease ABC subunit C
MKGEYILDLKEKIKNLPSSSGVYLMKDSLQSIIYVGKSKNLKSRVSSYFVNSKSHSPKVVKLVKNIKDFEYSLTDTEFEAFMLECKLIKKIKPIYNKKMKSPLSYTYIKISYVKQ